MAKPHIHAQSSAKKHGGILEDYLEIHEFMDSSKSAFADNRHRALTHQSWFITHVLPRVFGEFIINSNNKKVSVKQIGEDHVLEDFRGKFIPTVQDYLEELEPKSWMNNAIGQPPSSCKRIKHIQKSVINEKDLEQETNKEESENNTGNEIIDIPKCVYKPKADLNKTYLD